MESALGGTWFWKSVAVEEKKKLEMEFGIVFMHRKLHYPLVTMNMECPVKTYQFNIYV